MEETDTVSTLLGLILVIALVIFIIRIPIMIAKQRNVSASDLSTVAILSWLGIFFGITWIIAFILSLVYPQSENKNSSPVYITNFSNNSAPGSIPTEMPQSPASPQYDKFAELEKLDDLHKRGILTDTEFVEQKNIILTHERN